MTRKIFVLLALCWVNLVHAGDSVQLGDKIKSLTQNSHAPRLVYQQKPAVSYPEQHIVYCLNGGILSTLYNAEPICTEASVIYD